MINSYIFAILKLIFYYLFIVLKFILLHFLPSITSCLFLCFKKNPLLRSYAARCNFIPIGHGIPLAEKKTTRSSSEVSEKLRFIPFYLLKKDMIHCRHHHPHRLSSSSSSSMKQVSVIRLALYPSRSRVANEVVSLFLKLSISRNQDIWNIKGTFFFRQMRICGIFLPSLIVGLGLNPTKAFKQSFFSLPYIWSARRVP